MIKIEKIEVYGWEAAIRGMRNPMNSWDKSDSLYGTYCGVDENGNDIVTKDGLYVGENDLKLMINLSKAGSDHGKFLRMINVTCDLTAPLYWWKEYDTYKVGTVANSCSTMHKLTEKKFEVEDFSHDYLLPEALKSLCRTIKDLNYWRDVYFKAKTMDDPKPSVKKIWEQMIQLLPSSYNQKRTVQLNYQVLKNMYHARKNHKLDEWREFCKWCEELPCFKEICIEV
jgi:hypothetical protein